MILSANLLQALINTDEYGESIQAETAMKVPTNKVDASLRNVELGRDTRWNVNAVKSVSQKGVIASRLLARR
jgi:hypothetical protein